MESSARTALNSIIVLAVQLLAKVMALGATVYAARVVGVEEYGVYTYALSVATLAGIVSDLGLSPFTMREMASDRERAPEVFGTVLGLRLATGGLLVLGSALVPLFLSGNSQLRTLLFLVALYTALSQVADTFARAFAAFEAWKPFNRVALLGQVLGLLLSLLFLIVGRHIAGLPLGLSLGFVAAIAASWLSLARRMPVRARFQWRAWRTVMLSALPFAIGAMVGLFNQRVDLLLLFHVSGSAAVGNYGAAYSLLFSLSILPGACSSVLAPKLAANWKGDWGEQVAGHLRLLIKVLFALSLPATLGIVVLANRLAPLLFGAQFAGMGPVLGTLAWWLPAMFVQTLLTATFGALGRQRLAVAVMSGTVVGAVVLGIPLQLRYGAVGAAAARVVADWIGMGVLLALLPHRRTVLLNALELVKLLGATAGMAAALWGVRTWPLGLAISLGTLVYAVLVLLVRCFTPDEIPLLRFIPFPPNRSRGDHVNAGVSEG